MAIDIRLLELRDWLTVDEASDYLSNKLGSYTAAHQILRLALDGILELAVHIPAPVMAVFNSGSGDDPRRQTRAVDGLWDLILQGAGRIQVEHDERALNYKYDVPVDGRCGAQVRRGKEVCTLPPTGSGYQSAASALPEGARVVVRTSVLREFVGKVRQPDNVPLTQAGSGTATLTATFQNRAIWFRAIRDRKGMTAAGVQRITGIDDATQRKILEGAFVRADVLRKLCGKSGHAHYPNIQYEDIPKD